MNLYHLQNRAWFVARRARAGSRPDTSRSTEHWLLPPAGTRVYCRVHHTTQNTQPAPAVLIVPGLGCTGTALEDFSEPINVQELTSIGITVMTIDLSGRGASDGEDTFGGPAQHNDVLTALQHLVAMPEIDPSRVAVISLSLGCAAVAGALADKTAPELRWWLDWEGPCDREIITSGGEILVPAMGHSLDDDTYWHPREAVRHLSNITTPYIRYQSVRDHAQPGELRHATRMMTAASEASLPWYQLNSHARSSNPSNPHWGPMGYRAARDYIVETARLLLSK
jgi:hypothetical protein